MHQRSGDSFLGIPFNISSYALFVYILCNHINCTDKVLSKYNIYPGKLLMVFGDIHIYDEHINAVKTQILRNPYLFPQLKINYDIKTFNDHESCSIGKMEFNNLEFIDYVCYKHINAVMVV